jgi:hypothetical protein
VNYGNSNLDTEEWMCALFCYIITLTNPALKQKLDSVPSFVNSILLISSIC